MRTLLAILLAICFASSAVAQSPPKSKPKTKQKSSRKSSSKSSTPKATSSKKSTTKKKSSSSKTTSKKSSSSKTASSKSSSKASSKSTAKSDSSRKKKSTPPAGKKGPSKTKPWLSEATPALQKKAAAQVKRMKPADRSKLLTLLNKGKPEDFLKVEGIGKVKAQHLKKGRPYKKAEDAINITGIGEKLFTNMIKYAKKPPVAAKSKVSGKKATTKKAK